ncbi:MAG: hypothetical protein ACOC2W_01705 [bacterium]
MKLKIDYFYLKSMMKNKIKNSRKYLREFWGLRRTKRTFKYIKPLCINRSITRKKGIEKYNRLINAIYASGMVNKKYQQQINRKKVDEKKDKLYRDIEEMINNHFNEKISELEHINNEADRKYGLISKMERYVNKRIDEMRKHK